MNGPGLVSSQPTFGSPSHATDSIALFALQTCPRSNAPLYRVEVSEPRRLIRVPIKTPRNRERRMASVAYLRPTNHRRPAIARGIEEYVQLPKLHRSRNSLRDVGLIDGIAYYGAQSRLEGAANRSPDRFSCRREKVAVP